MPYKPAGRCPRCKRRHYGGGRCAACRAATDPRPPASQRGYDHHHRTEFRRAVLEQNPNCRCDRPGRHGHGQTCWRRATTADHHPRTRRELEDAGLDPNDPHYGRGLCAPCHSSLTNEGDHPDDD